MIPSLDSLKACHSFPDIFVIKAIGSGTDFERDASEAIRRALGLESQPPYSARESRGGRHRALTFEILFPSAEAVVAAYQELLGVQGLIMLL